MKKEAKPIIIIVLLVIAVTLIGMIAYNFYTNKSVKVQQETAQPVVEPTKPAGIEQPAKIEQQPESSKDVIIQIHRYDFDKPNIVIETGTKVIWNNTDTRTHMITDKSGYFVTHLRKPLGYGETFEYTFNEPGTYLILDAVFGMHGTVIVKEKNTNLITGNAVLDIMPGSGNFLLSAINIFVITMTLLVFGFYLSRYKV